MYSTGKFVQSLQMPSFYQCFANTLKTKKKKTVFKNCATIVLFQYFDMLTLGV